MSVIITGEDLSIRVTY